MIGPQPLDFDEWKRAVGRNMVERQRLELEPLRRFAVAVGADPNVETALPPLPHWAFFLPLPLDSQIGEDGHPRRGDFLPAVTLPRRMFAAAEIQFCEPLLLGEEAEMVSTIVDVARKTGRSGDLVFAEVEKVLVQRGSARIRERQSYVYRDAGPPTPMPTPTPVATVGGLEGELWQPTAVELFRFSAATFNGHRIHYDLQYARHQEGYPELVVHGPFTAAKLATVARRDGILTDFSFRAQAPLFVGQPIRLVKGLDDDPGDLIAVRCDGATAMSARVRYA